MQRYPWLGYGAFVLAYTFIIALAILASPDQAGAPTSEKAAGERPAGVVHVTRR